MKLKNRKPIGLEALEDRWVPATIRFDGSNLTVSSPLITAGASKIQVIETATPGAFQVLDGVANNGTYAVTGNVTVLGNNAKDNVIFTVKTTLSGNLSVSTGNGVSSVTVDGTAATSSVAGNTRINMGLGVSKALVGTTNGLSNKGSLSVSSRSSGVNTVGIGGGANSTFVGGPLSITGFNSVTLGGANKDVFAGGVNVNVSNGSFSSITLVATSKDLGNFTVQGGQGNTTVNVNAPVLGNASLNLGNGTNSVSLATSTIGSLTYTGGNGSNTLATVGAAGTVTVLGNVALNWGNGANILGPTTALTVQGNMSVNIGNGSLDAKTATFQAVVFGNLNVNTGNGNSSFTFDGTAGASVGGPFNYTGGNGGNNVTVNNATPNLITLNVRFGNNTGTGAAATSNVFVIGAGATAGTLTGLVSWGVPSLTINGNAFVDNGYVWMNNVTLLNVPS